MVTFAKKIDNEPAYIIYSKDLVKDIPNFLRIEWSQYTPYFNDGDSCEFGIYSTDLYLLEPNEISDNADYHSIDGEYTYEVGKDIRRSIDDVAKKTKIGELLDCIDSIDSR